MIEARVILQGERRFASNLASCVWEGDEAPRGLDLSASPNPFNPATEIFFRLDRPDRVRLDVFDVRGRRVATLLDESLNAGEHRVRWQARDLSTGVYYYRLQMRDVVETRQLVVLK